MAVRNVARIVRSDVKSLFANVMSIIIVVGFCAAIATLYGLL